MEVSAEHEIRRMCNHELSASIGNGVQVVIIMDRIVGCCCGICFIDKASAHLKCGALARKPKSYAYGYRTKDHLLTLKTMKIDTTLV